MLRQAVFLCLLLAGMAEAQVHNYIISSIFSIVLKVVAIMGDWKSKIGSESFLLQAEIWLSVTFNTLAVIKATPL